jgi:hypothetical protein
MCFATICGEAAVGPTDNLAIRHRKHPQIWKFRVLISIFNTFFLPIHRLQRLVFAPGTVHPQSREFHLFNAKTAFLFVDFTIFNRNNNL